MHCVSLCLPQQTYGFVSYEYKIEMELNFLLLPKLFYYFLFQLSAAQIEKKVQWTKLLIPITLERFITLSSVSIDSLIHYNELNEFLVLNSFMQNCWWWLYRCQSIITILILISSECGCSESSKVRNRFLRTT